MKWFIFLLCAALSGCALIADKTPPIEKYGEMITSSDLKEYLTVIAADDMEGRQTGSRGQDKAADFIEKAFRQFELAPLAANSYFQSFDLFSTAIDTAYIRIGESQYKNYEEIAYLGSYDSKGEVPLDIVFAGKGRDEDFAHLNVKDKAVVILSALPEGGLTLLFHSLTQKAIEKGAKMVFVVPEKLEEFTSASARIRSYMAAGPLSLSQPGPAENYKGGFILSPAVAAKLFSTDMANLIGAANDSGRRALRKIDAAKLKYRVAIKINTVKSRNVLGYLEGTDKKEELVIITAHYDHIGMTAPGPDHINNGADDDGSGTVAVLEMARNFAKAKKDGHGPRRSILFMTVSAEEQGLLGSEYYTDHPVFPLANTVVDLNIDMIGRTDPQHRDSTQYVYVIGSDKLSADLHQLSETTNNTYTRLKFDYTYNDENHPSNLYKRSDHWNFAKKGIPIIFYFDGVHEDYHKPTDEVSRIDFDLLTKRTKCVFFTAWEIANREGRIQLDKK